MPDPVITNNSPSGLVVRSAVFQDETLTLAGADTLVAGTILARDSVSLKLVIFAKGGTTNGNGIPKAVLTEAVTVTGAGDVAIRPAISGELRKGDLIIDADGDGSNVDAAVLDQLRDFTILSLDVNQLAELDNQ